jgi:hypothetical protein
MWFLPKINLKLSHIPILDPESILHEICGGERLRTHQSDLIIMAYYNKLLAEPLAHMHAGDVLSFKFAELKNDLWGRTCFDECPSSRAPTESLVGIWTRAAQR